MAFPDGMLTYPIVGQVAGVPDFSDLEVRFISHGWLNSPVHDAIVKPFHVDAEIGAGGTFAALLPPTDDPTWTAFEYEVVVRAGGKTLRGSVTVPFSQPDGMDLSDRIQYDVPAAPSVPYMPLSLRGAPDGVASLDGDGLLPIEELPAHAHAIDDVADLETQLAGKQPAGTYLEPDDIANLVSSETLNEGLDLKADKTNAEFVDTTVTVRKGDNSAALRLRATGGAVDIDKSAGNIYLSSFAGSGGNPFGGAQINIGRLRNNGITLAGKTEFGTTADTSENYVDVPNGIALLGSKAGAALPITGYKATPGPPTAGTWAVDQQMVDSDGVWWRCIAAGTPGGWAGMPAASNLLTSGEEVLPRDDVAGELGLISGVVYWSYFTARKSETITQMRSATGATAAAGLTLARIGVYSTNGTSLTLVASTANDTALWAATNTMYPKTFSAPWTKVAGQRYAVAYLALGTTMPTLEAVSVRPNSVGLAPRIQGELSGRTDLPATGQTEAGMTSGFRRFQAILLP